MRATKIYRDNFVYNINTPLCEGHANKCQHSQYSYIETYSGDEECKHCQSDVRDAAYKANKIHWFLYVDDKLVYEHKDRFTFWPYLNKYLKANGGCNAINWKVRENILK